MIYIHFFFVIDCSQHFKKQFDSDSLINTVWKLLKPIKLFLNLFNRNLNLSCLKESSDAVKCALHNSIGLPTISDTVATLKQNSESINMDMLCTEMARKISKDGGKAWTKKGHVSCAIVNNKDPSLPKPYDACCMAISQNIGNNLLNFYTNLFFMVLI